MLRRASLPLIGLLAFLGAARGEGPPTTMAMAIGPFVDAETAVIVRLDLTGLDVRKSARRLLGPVVDKGTITRPIRDLADWTESLRKAGAAEVFVIVEADPLGRMDVAIPLAAGADRAKLEGVLAGAGLDRQGQRWQVGTAFDKVVFAGIPKDMERVRRADAKAPLPPWIAEAMKAEEAGDVRVFFAMPRPLREIIEKQDPTFPPLFGGGPVTVLTRGLKWASMGVRFEPKASIHATARASDPAAARDFDKLAAVTLRTLAPIAANALKAFGPDAPPVPGLAKVVERIEIKVDGDRLTAGLDVDNVADLIRAPLAQVRPRVNDFQCVNNLKQIMLAMHNYHANENVFPPAFKASKTGKPLLSWRVLILPYLDQNNLYKEFHLDEPWHSPHNKTLIARMPDVYRCPGLDPEATPVGKTSYLAPRGKRTILSGGTGISMIDVTDGTSFTIAVVDAGADNMVVWTVPDDWEIDGVELKPETILKQHGAGSYVGFTDGSVRLLRSTIKPEVFGALLTRNGGEVIAADDF